MTTTPVAEFESVTKDYYAGAFKRRPVRALTEVSFRVNPGEVFGVMGPNRAGKSTLIKVLLSLTRPTQGRALRFGTPVQRRQTLCRVGFTHEHQSFPSYLTGRGVLEFYGTLSGLTKSSLRTTTSQLLERVQLSDQADEAVSTYSKGMVARLGLAQALVNDPALLVLDEPYEGLDVSGQQLVHKLIRERREGGQSVLLITHEPSDIEQLCDRVLLLKNGKAVFTGTPDELKSDAPGGRPSLEKALQRYFKYTL